jgi:nitroreductase
MNAFSELITRRRSVRQFSGEALSPDEVKQIMRAALLSPSARNGRSWQFVLVEDAEMLKQLSRCKASGAAFVADCALAVVVLTDPLQSEPYIEDASIAASYIQLQVEDLGLGSCWVQLRGRETETGGDSEQYVRDLLDIPLQLSVGCILAIGRKAKASAPHDEAALPWEKIHIGKY